MSLYDDASLIMIPSGVKAGTVYSQKPMDSDGQFTFTRASEATRLVDGVVTKVRTNSILQSNDFSNASWIKTRSSVTGGQADKDGGTDAWSFLVDTSSTTSHFLTYNHGFTGVGTVSIYAKANGYSWFRIYTGGDYAYFDVTNGLTGASTVGISASISSVGGGWYRCSVAVADLSSSTVLYINIAQGDEDTVLSGTPSGTTGLFIMNAQVEAGTVATDYIATTTVAVSEGPVANMPRLNSVAGGCPSLLLEPQRTNAITSSEYFGDSSWTKAGDVTLTSNYGISPDGYVNADRIVAHATAGGHIVYRNIGTTGTHTVSIFAKASGYDYMFLGYDGGNLNFGIVFNLSNGTISQNPAGLTGSIEGVGSDGWYRCTLTFNYATTSYYFVVAPHDNSGAYNWTGNGTDGVLIYAAQAEYSSSYATSYIPTYGTAATRVADVCYKTGITSLIGQTEGTMFMEVDLTHSNIGGVNEYLMQIYYNGSNRILMYRNTLNDLECYFLNAGVNFSSNLTTVASGRHKLAFAYKSGDCAFYIDGVQAFTHTATFSAFSSLADLHIGANGTGQTEAAKYSYNQALLFKTRLTNAELATLTTL